MTPQEKAEELVKKYEPYVCGYIGSSMLTNIEYPEQILKQAKQCVLIAVDEILWEIKFGKKLDWISERKNGQEYIVYWQEVKQEIEKL